ncbi:beta strand repeat-containing protein [Rhodopila sp.]|uniref:beta strand repeat-containing protein n=1 Tax=Rhodopila sp. TaxID=2480087 RepID=UPI003D1217FF
MQSPNNTVISLATQQIVDLNGNVWSILNGQVAVNGSVDLTTGNVIEMAYENGTIWQKNSANLWWSKTMPSGSWSPSYGTMVDPIPNQVASPNNTLLTINAVGASLSAITDASGNVWSIVSGQVALNGVVDATTRSVIALAYENGTIWQKNADNLWWGKTTPASFWSPPYGTSVDPIPNQVASPNNTVIAEGNAGTVGTFTDASGNIWSIAAGQVTLNGAADPTTANVTQMAYVNGQVWQENASGLWWSKTTPASPWSPPYGSAANPVQGVDINLAFNAASPGSGAVFNLGMLSASGTGGEPGSTALSMPYAAAGVTTTGVQLTDYNLAFSALVQLGYGPLIIDGNSGLADDSTLSFQLKGTGGLPPGPLENNGTMTVSASTLTVGVLTGQGVITATGNSTLDIDAADTGETIQLQAGQLYIGGASQQTDAGMTFLAPITDFGAGSAITLYATQATDEVFVRRGPTAGELYLYNGTVMVADLLISGQTNIYASAANGSVTLSATDSAGALPIVGSANNTVVAANPTGSSGAVFDAGGNAWTITSGGKVAFNGVAIPATANVIELAYVGGVVWQENSSDNWVSIVHTGTTFSTSAAPTTVNPVQGVNLDLQTGTPGTGAGETFSVGALSASSGSSTIRIPTGAASLTSTGVQLASSSLLVEDFNGNGQLIIDGNSTLAAGARLNVQELGATSLPNGPLANNGTMTVSAATLQVGSLTGTGVVSGTASSDLEVGSAGGGETIQLSAATLFIGGGVGGVANPGMNFLAPITNFGASSSIILFQTNATSEVFNHTSPTAGELFLYNSAKMVADLHISGQANLYASFNPEPAFGPYGSVTLTATDGGHSLPITSH